MSSGLPPPFFFLLKARKEPVEEELVLAGVPTRLAPEPTFCGQSASSQSLVHRAASQGPRPPGPGSHCNEQPQLDREVSWNRSKIQNRSAVLRVPSFNTVHPPVHPGLGEAAYGLQLAHEVWPILSLLPVNPLFPWEMGSCGVMAD